MLPDQPVVRFVQLDTISDAPHEECGVFGVSTPHGEGVAQTVFFGLFALQHRGQEAAGIAVSDGSRVRLHKDTGLVANVFTPATMNPLTGYHGIGHTRYSTTGANAQRNIQPFLVETMHGPLALAHNGNLVNAPALRDELLTRGFGLTATSDTEVMTLMLAAAGGRTWEDRIERTLPAWKGAFSLVILAADRVIAVRDPWGFRPMSVGRLPARRLRRRLRDLRAQHARLRRHQRGRARRDRHAQRRRDDPPPGADSRRTFGALHVRVRLLQPARQRVGRPQHAPRPPAPRRGAGRRGTGRRRRGHPRARLLDPRGHRLQQGQRHPPQRRADQEPLHRPHVHRADAGPARPRRRPEVQRARPRTSPASGS